MPTKVSDTFSGIDFSSPTGWQRIEKAIASLLTAIVDNDRSTAP